MNTSVKLVDYQTKKNALNIKSHAHTHTRTHTLHMRIPDANEAAEWGRCQTYNPFVSCPAHESAAPPPMRLRKKNERLFFFYDVFS